MRNEKKKKKKKRNRIIGEGGEDESENRMLKVIEMINFFLSYREQFVSEGKEIGSSVDGRNRGLMVIFTLTTSRLCVCTRLDVRTSDIGRYRSNVQVILAVFRNQLSISESIIASPVRCQKFRLKTSWCYHVLSVQTSWCVLPLPPSPFHFFHFKRLPTKVWRNEAFGSNFHVPEFY